MNTPRSFFLTTNPGLESAAHSELCSVWERAPAFLNLPATPKVSRHKGGLEFEAPLQWGLQLNSWLRTATRMLLRESLFECGHERDLFAGLSQIRWQDYITKERGYTFSFTSKASRISKEDQIEKVLNKVFKRHDLKRKANGIVIYIRIVDDKCNISFDCSGVGAFKRGEKQKGSIASLRASIASGLLRYLLQGVAEPFVLIDPMCGAGTFLDEALQLDRPMRREFAYHYFPCYKKAEKVSLEVNNRNLKKVYGFDLSDKALAVAEKNFQRDEEGFRMLKVANLFEPEEGLVSDEDFKKIVIVNPPWGMRLPAPSEDLLKALYNKYQPDRLGILIPATWKMGSIPLEKIQDIPIFNSGVENRFLIYSRQPYSFLK